MPYAERHSCDWHAMCLRKGVPGEAVMFFTDYARRFGSGTLLVALAISMGVSRGSFAGPLPPPAWSHRHWPLSFDANPEGLIGVAREDFGPLVACSTREVFTFDGQRLRPLRMDLPAGDTIARGCLTLDGSSNRTLIYLPLQTGSLLVLDGDATNFFPLQASPSGLSLDSKEGTIPTSAGWSPHTGFWMAHRDGSVSRHRDGRLATVLGPAADRTYGGAYLVVDFRGRIWVAREGILAVWSDNHFAPQATLPPGEALLAASHDGGIWVKVRTQLLYHDLRHNRLEPRSSDMVGTATRMVEDQQRRLWIGTSRFGMHMLSHGELTEVPCDARWVKDLCVDDEGTIWTASPLGLDSYRDGMVSTTATAEAPLVTGLAQDGRSRIWFLTLHGQVGRYRDPSSSPSTMSHAGPLPTYLDHPTVAEAPASAIVGSTNGVWIGTRNGRLFHHTTGQTKELPLPGWAAGQSIDALLESGDGSLWLAVGNRLVCQQPDHQLTATEEGIRLDDGDQVAAMVEHPVEIIWAVTRAGKLLRLHPNDRRQAARTVAVETHVLPGGLPPESKVTSICRANGGGVWIAVRSSGLWRFQEGQWSAVDGRHDLPTTLFTGAVRDHLGYLWCGCDGGLFIADASELESAADGLAPRVHCWVFPAGGDTNFLREITSPRAATLLADDGCIFFGLRSSLAIGHPAAIPVAASVPIGVRQIRVAGERIAELDSLSTSEEAFPRFVTLPARPRDIEVDYAISSFVTPTNIALFHQLVGIDRDWVQSPSPGSARYAALPAGRYEFRLRSSDHRGKNAAHTAFVCEVPPVVWEQAWFRAGAVLLVTACGLLGFAGAQAVRSRSRVAHLRQQAVIDQERMRIARDMHDEVGTSLNQIALLAEVARQESRPEGREQLDGVVTIARRTMAAFDELVWAVNPENDSLPHLLSYVSQYATEVLTQFGIRSRVMMAPVFPEVPVTADVRHAILMIVKEAVANIVAHAGARCVEIKTVCHAGRLMITLTDDGQGLGAETKRTGQGLRNMQARAEAFGGSFQIESLATGGTAVKVELDLSRGAGGSTS